MGSRHPDLADPSLRYYIDGSVLFASTSYAAAAAAVIVVDQQGTLVAIGSVLLPSTVTAAAEAELYALVLLCQTVVCLPIIYTDCLSVKRSLDKSPQLLCSSNSAHAALWTRLLACCDGTFDRLRAKLCWMPAHKTQSQIGHVFKSNGNVVTFTDWRGNRLADAVAKAAAWSRVVDPDLRQGGARLKVLLQMFTHISAALAVVTAAANDAPPVGGSSVRRRGSDSFPLKLKRASKRRRARRIDPPAIKAPPQRRPLTPAQMVRTPRLARRHSEVQARISLVNRRRAADRREQRSQAMVNLAIERNRFAADCPLTPFRHTVSEADDAVPFNAAVGVSADVNRAGASSDPTAGTNSVRNIHGTHGAALPRGRQRDALQRPKRPRSRDDSKADLSLGELLQTADRTKRRSIIRGAFCHCCRGCCDRRRFLSARPARRPSHLWP